MTWTSPTTNQKIRAYELDLAVQATATDLRRIEFVVAWEGGSAKACTASRPDANGVWSCKADLLRARVLPGPVRFSVKAVDTRERAIPELKRSQPATYAVVPPRPGSVKVENLSFTGDTGTPAPWVQRDRINWTSPKGYADEFRLYGVTSCPNDAPGNDGEPCLVPGTPLEKNDLKLIKTVDGSARSMTIENEIDDGLCAGGLWCSEYYAIVLGAFNAYGNSVYAIPMSAEVCHMCTY